MEAIFNTDEVKVTLKEKEFTLKCLPVIKWVKILNILPLDLLAKAISGQGENIKGLAEFLQKDAYSILKACHEATGIEIKFIEDLQLHEFSKLVEGIIEANKTSFEMALEPVKKKVIA